MNLLERSTKNIIFNIGGWGIPILTYFVATPLLIRGLGESGYGLQTLVGVIIGYFSVMDMGFDLVGTKYIAEDYAKSAQKGLNSLLSANLQILLFVGTLGLIGIFLMAKIFVNKVFNVPSSMVKQAIVIFRLAGIIFFLKMILMWAGGIPTGLQRYDIVNIVSVVSLLISAFVGLLMVYLGFGVVGYVSIKVVTSFLACIAYIPIIRKLLPNVKLSWRFDKTIFNRIRRFAFYGFIFRISGILTTGVDRTLISAWIGMSALTYYSVPYLVASSLGQLLGRMFNFIFPLASSLAATDQIEKLRDIFTRATRFIAGLATMIAVPLFFYSDMILGLWVGPNIAAHSTTVMRLLVLAFYIQTMTSSLMPNILMGVGRIRLFAIYSLIRSSIITSSCVLFISALGLRGAGLAQVSAGMADVAIFVYVVSRCLHLSLRKIILVSYLRPILLGIVLGGVSYLLRPFAITWLGLSVVFCVLVSFYALMGYHYFAVFGETEKRAVKVLWRLVTMQR